MGSKTRLGSYCTKRANNGVNLVTSRNINTRLARPIVRPEGSGMKPRTHLGFLSWASFVLGIANTSDEFIIQELC